MTGARWAEPFGRSAPIRPVGGKNFLNLSRAGTGAKGFLTRQTYEGGRATLAKACPPMPRKFSRFAGAVLASRSAARLAAAATSCRPSPEMGGAPPPGEVSPARRAGGRRIVVAAGSAEGETDGPYLLDTGDRLRIFIYGHPNLSRLYTVDQQGMVSVPLIGDVPARGRTTKGLRVPSRHASAPIRQGAASHRRHRPEPAVLHPGRGAQRRPVPLRERHDGARARWRSPAATATAPTSAASRSPAAT